MFSSLLKATVAIVATPVTLVADTAVNLKDCMVGDDPRGFKNTESLVDSAAKNFKNAVEPERKKQLSLNGKNSTLIKAKGGFTHKA